MFASSALLILSTGKRDISRNFLFSTYYSSVDNQNEKSWFPVTLSLGEVIATIITLIFAIVIFAIIMVDVYPTNPGAAIGCMILLVIASLWVFRGLLFARGIARFVFGKRERTQNTFESRPRQLS